MPTSRERRRPALRPRRPSGEVNEGQSVRLDAAEQASAPANYVFESWASIDGHPFTVIGGTGGRSICVCRPRGGAAARMFRATYEAANAAPSRLPSDNASRYRVLEGTEGHQYREPGPTPMLATTVTLRCVGWAQGGDQSCTNAAGTWSWSTPPQGRAGELGRTSRSPPMTGTVSPDTTSFGA